MILYEKGRGLGPYCYVQEAFRGKSENIITSLRLWRDEVLASDNLLKKKFVNFYYEYLCHQAGKLLRTVPALRPLARISILLFTKVNGIKISAS